MDTIKVSLYDDKLNELSLLESPARLCFLTFTELLFGLHSELSLDIHLTIQRYQFSQVEMDRCLSPSSHLAILRIGDNNPVLSQDVLSGNDLCKVPWRQR